MGGLQALKSTLPYLALLLTFGCDAQERKGTFTTRERSQAVSTPTQGVTSAAAAPPTVERDEPAEPRPRRALCGGKLDRFKLLPRKSISRATASNGQELPDQRVLQRTTYTWVNFWAAWCAPCKEEIPRLRAWERKLAPRLGLSFVSLDDDARQLRAFLESSADLRASYWLKEGEERDEWMIAAGLEPDPELPIHLLVDSEGRIRCKIQGAVEDADLADLVRLIGG